MRGGWRDKVARLARPRQDGVVPQTTTRGGRRAEMAEAWSDEARAAALIARRAHHIGLPPEPGTTTLPRGYVKAFHYTDPALLERIKERGLRLENARGHLSDEPDRVWASERMPAINRGFAELHIPADDPAIWHHYKGGDLALDRDVTPDEIVAVHQPWHHVARTLLAGFPVDEGQHDSLLDMPGDEWAPGVAAWKRAVAEVPPSDADEALAHVTQAGADWLDARQHGEDASDELSAAQAEYRRADRREGRRAKARRKLAEAKNDMVGRGAMIALYPSPEVARRIALPGGEDADQLHVTLTFHGTADEIDDPEALKRAVAEWAKGTPPIAGVAGGVGLFTEGPKPVTFLPIDAPELPAAFTRLVDATAGAGAKPRQDHGFTPHMTLDYADRVDDAKDAAGQKFRFARVALVLGEERTFFSLEGEPTIQEALVPVRGHTRRGKDGRIIHVGPSIRHTRGGRRAALRKLLRGTPAAHEITPEASVRQRKQKRKAAAHSQKGWVYKNPDSVADVLEPGDTVLDVQHGRRGKVIIPPVPDGPYATSMTRVQWTHDAEGKRRAGLGQQEVEALTLRLLKPDPKTPKDPPLPSKNADERFRGQAPAPNPERSEFDELAADGKAIDLAAHLPNAQDIGAGILVRYRIGKGDSWGYAAVVGRHGKTLRIVPLHGQQSGIGSIPVDAVEEARTRPSGRGTVRKAAAWDERMKKVKRKAKGRVGNGAGQTIVPKRKARETTAKVLLGESLEDVAARTGVSVETITRRNPATMTLSHDWRGVSTAKNRRGRHILKGGRMTDAQREAILDGRHGADLAEHIRTRPLPTGMVIDLRNAPARRVEVGGAKKEVEDAFAGKAKVRAKPPLGKTPNTPKAKKERKSRAGGQNANELQLLPVGDHVTWEAEDGSGMAGSGYDDDWLPVKRAIKIANVDAEHIQVYDPASGTHHVIHHSWVVSTTHSRSDPRGTADLLARAREDASKAAKPQPPRQYPPGHPLHGKPQTALAPRADAIDNQIRAGEAYRKAVDDLNAPDWKGSGVNFRGRSVWFSNERKLGTVDHDGGAFIAHDADEQEIGRYDTEEKARIAVARKGGVRMLTVGRADIYDPTPDTATGGPREDFGRQTRRWDEPLTHPKNCRVGDEVFFGGKRGVVIKRGRRTLGVWTDGHEEQVDVKDIHHVLQLERSERLDNFRNAGTITVQQPTGKLDFAGAGITFRQSSVWHGGAKVGAARASKKGEGFDAIGPNGTVLSTHPDRDAAVAAVARHAVITVPLETKPVKVSQSPVRRMPTARRKALMAQVAADTGRHERLIDAGREKNGAAQGQSAPFRSITYSVSEHGVDRWPDAPGDTYTHDHEAGLRTWTELTDAEKTYLAGGRRPRPAKTNAQGDLDEDVRWPDEEDWDAYGNPLTPKLDAINAKGRFGHIQEQHVRMTGKGKPVAVKSYPRKTRGGKRASAQGPDPLDKAGHERHRAHVVELIHRARGGQQEREHIDRRLRRTRQLATMTTMNAVTPGDAPAHALVALTRAALREAFMETGWTPQARAASLLARRKHKKPSREEMHRARAAMRPAGPGETRTADGRAIPPKWTGVHVHDDPSHPIQARGVDEAGRPQQIRSRTLVRNNDDVKFERLAAMHEVMPHIDEMLKQGVAAGDQAAAVLMLIRHMGLRPGSERDTKAKKKAHGATTLETGHVTVTGDKVGLKFVGKEGVENDLEHEHPELAAMIQAQIKGKAPGEQVFPDANDRQVRRLMSKIAPGFTPKDLRTHLATREAAAKVKSMKAPQTAQEHAAARMEVAKHVSEILGNRPKQALDSYIDPSVFHGWGEPPAPVKKVRAKAKKAPKATRKLATA